MRITRMKNNIQRFFHIIVPLSLVITLARPSIDLLTVGLQHAIYSPIAVTKPFDIFIALSEKVP